MSVTPFGPANWPVTPITNVTPFTYGEGYTYLAILEQLKQALTSDETTINDAINSINQFYTDAQAAYTQFRDDQAAALQALAASLVDYTVGVDANGVLTLQMKDQQTQVQAYVKDKIDSLIADVQASITTQVATETNARQAADAAEVTARQNGDSTEATARANADAAEATARANADAAEATARANADAAEVTRVNNLITGLDSVYVKKLPQQHAVFVGTSNVVTGTWPGVLCADRGWTEHNFAVGGMAFSYDGTNNFQMQLTHASVDPSFNNSDVNYVFICDAGNDARSSLRPTNYITTINAAKAFFPNARVIILPLILSPYAPIDRTKNLLGFAGFAASDLADACASTGVEYINYSWTWLIDHPELFKTGEIHCTPDGYARIAYWVGQYLDGHSTDCMVKRWQPNNWHTGFMTGDTTTFAGVGAWRTNGIITVGGFIKATATNSGTVTAFTLPAGLSPNTDSMPVSITNYSTADNIIAGVDINGNFQLTNAVANALYGVHVTYPYI